MCNSCLATNCIRIDYKFSADFVFILFSGLLRIESLREIGVIVVAFQGSFASQIVCLGKTDE